MWIVERSDIGLRTPVATGRDAKRYIGCLGRMVAITASTFDVCLPSGEHVTATIARG
jgi:hypothetical protein